MTKLSIDNFVSIYTMHEESKFESNSGAIDSIKKWVIQNPTRTKTIIVTSLIFGTILCIGSPFLLANKSIIVLLSICGGLQATVSYLALKYLNILCPSLVQNSRFYKEHSMGVGRLYYPPKSDVPILEIFSDIPYHAGHSMGYLAAEGITVLLKHLSLQKSLFQLPSVDKIPNTLKAIKNKIPQEYVEEMQGIVEGYNQWLDEKKSKEKKLTFEELLFIHLIPELTHFNPIGIENSLTGKFSDSIPQLPPNNSGTIVVAYDKNEGIVFGNQLNFEIPGQTSLVINRKYKKKEKDTTVEVGFPGFAGTCLGINSKGFSLAMNTCQGYTNKVEGMPAVFFNRQCLTTCKGVYQVSEKMFKSPPLGSYNLTLADPDHSMTYHFFQGTNQDNKHVKQSFIKFYPLVVTNCRTNEEGDESRHTQFSLERADIVKKLFSQSKESVSSNITEHGTKLVKSALKLPYVDTDTSIAQVVMYPQSRSIELAFSNSHSGRKNLQKLNLNPVDAITNPNGLNLFVY